MKFLYLAIAILFLTNCTSNKKSKENKKEEIVKFDANDSNTWSEDYKKSMDSLVNRSSNAIIASNEERTEKYIDSVNHVIKQNTENDNKDSYNKYYKTIQDNYINNIKSMPGIPVASLNDLNQLKPQALVMYKESLLDGKNNLKFPQGFTKEQKSTIKKLFDDKIKLCESVLEEKKTQSAPQ